MRFTICKMCEEKMYAGEWIYGTDQEYFCSEDCLFNALGIIECTLTEDECEGDDAE